MLNHMTGDSKPHVLRGLHLRPLVCGSLAAMSVGTSWREDGASSQLLIKLMKVDSATCSHRHTTHD